MNTSSSSITRWRTELTEMPTQRRSYVVEAPGDCQRTCDLHNTLCCQFLATAARTSGSTPPGDCSRAFPAAISSCEHGTIRRETSIGVIASCSVRPFPGDASAAGTRQGPSLHPGSPIQVNPTSDGLTAYPGTTRSDVLHPRRQRNCECRETCRVAT